MTEEHARFLAQSPGIKGLRSLDLSGYWELRPTAVQALFFSNYLRSLIHLDLGGTRIGTEGVIALANAKDLIRLRSLIFWGAGLNQEGWRVLLASPNMHSLTRLNIDGGELDGPTLDLSPDTAAELSRLPHLAHLQLWDCRCPPRSRELLSTSESLAWVWIDRDDDFDILRYRANRAPERFPPVDDDFEPHFDGR
ncbi:MAG TPA: hypothetical protein VH682_19220 [Gemmataceae bacterium]|jgi:hypothetical protein